MQDIRILRSDAAHGTWSPDGQLIAYDAIGADGFYDVLMMSAEGSPLGTLTEAALGLPQRHNGWPAWHPDGKLIVFQSEEPQHYLSDNAKMRDLGSPGLGLFNNLWGTTPDRRAFWKLTDIPIKQSLLDGIPAQGVVNPVFSHDGRRMVWTMRADKGGYLDWGQWEIRSAEFRWDGSTVSLARETALLRARDVCAECNYVNAMAFLPGDRSLLLAGNLDGQHVYGMDLYLYDLKTKRLQNLLSTPDDWEEGSCLSPDGRRIVYQTNIGSPFRFDPNDKGWAQQPRTREWWLLDLQTLDRQRLTFFNTPGSPEYDEIGQGRRVITAKCSFSPDGRRMLGIIGIDAAPPDGDRVAIRLSLAVVEFR